MKALPCCSSKWNIVLTIIMTLMLICAIVLPVYISTLDGQTDTVNPSGSTVTPTKGGDNQQQTSLSYASDGGLQFKRGDFLLDGKQFRIVSGAFHYFRTIPERWHDVFHKMKALGLNTVET